MFNASTIEFENASNAFIVRGKFHKRRPDGSTHHVFNAVKKGRTWFFEDYQLGKVLTRQEMNKLFSNLEAIDAR